MWILMRQSVYNMYENYIYSCDDCNLCVCVCLRPLVVCNPQRERLLVSLWPISAHLNALSLCVSVSAVYFYPVCSQPLGSSSSIICRLTFRWQMCKTITCCTHTQHRMQWDKQKSNKNAKLLASNFSPIAHSVTIKCLTSRPRERAKIVLILAVYEVNWSLLGFIRIFLITKCAHFNFTLVRLLRWQMWSSCGIQRCSTLKKKRKKNQLNKIPDFQ